MFDNYHAKWFRSMSNTRGKEQNKMEKAWNFVLLISVLVDNTLKKDFVKIYGIMYVEKKCVAREQWWAPFFKMA